MVNKLCYNWADIDEVRGETAVKPELPKPVVEAKPKIRFLFGYGIAAKRAGEAHFGLYNIPTILTKCIAAASVCSVQLGLMR